MTKPTEGNTMIPAQPGATKGYVLDNDAPATTEGLITIGTDKYRPYVPASDAGKDIYVLQVGSAAAYANNHKYTKTVTTKTVDSDATDKKMSEAVDANGLVRFDGLGEGTYTISETVTPNGYNTISDFQVKVIYDADAEQYKFKIDDNATDVVYEDGIYKIKVVNEKGGTMPETGGIGTKIFYTMGAVLVIGAGVVLVSRKRAGE